MVTLMSDPTKRNRNLIASARAEAAGIPGQNDAEEPGRTDTPAVAGYRLLRSLGSGGQGTVFEALQLSTGRRVALKLVRASSATSDERFQREIRVLAHLRHPHIVTVYDSGRSNGHHYYAMELVAGRPLDAFVHDTGLSRRETLKLFGQVCDAVHAAHQRGVIHRDLKPANILVDESGSPRVLDFGLAKPLPEPGDATRTAAQVTEAGQFLGTLAWASPEQVRGNPHEVDIRTDVYSLGAILYRILTGITPYDTDGSLPEALDNILNARPQAPSAVERSIDHDLETILLRCLAKAPAERYGTVGEVAADLRRYLAGEPIEAKRDSRLYVLRKTLGRHRVLVGSAGLALLFGLCFGAVMSVLYQQAREGEKQAVAEAQALRAELEKLKGELLSPANWTSAFNTARALQRLDAEEGWVLLKSAWDEMREDSPKQQLLKATNVAQPPYLVRVMNLGMRDPSPAVQSWAINYLRQVAFQDFAEDFSAYERWYEAYGNKELAAVLEANFRDFARRLREAEGDGRATLLDRISPASAFHDHPTLTEVANETGMTELLLEMLSAEATSRDGRRQASRVLAAMDLDEAWVCERILPLVDRQDAEGEIRNGAIEIIERRKAACAIDPLLESLRAEFGKPARERDFNDAASALGRIGDPRVIPDLIAMIDADNTYDTVYGIGYFGLGELTGVQYDEAHDGAWWRSWWEKNRQRFGEAVAKRDIPTLDVPGAAKSSRDPSEPGRDRTVDRAGGDAASDDLPVQDLLAGGNRHQRYFLIGPRGAGAAPAEGYRLLLVLPGGDGSADFHPFVKRIAAQAAPDNYLVAQLVAPRWSPEQFNNVVWPTAGLAWASAEFTTEAFVAAVVRDIRARYTIDARFVFALGWSSGGPPVYAAATGPDSPLRGAFVAMSVFKPDQLSDLDGASGKAFYVLHSPDDFIPMRFPEAARDTLRAHGAATELARYEGGHGWHGDVYGNLRAGIDWLEAQVR